MEGECEQWMLTSLSSGAVQISLIIDSSRRGTLHDIVTRIDLLICGAISMIEVGYIVFIYNVV